MFRKTCETESNMPIIEPRKEWKEFRWHRPSDGMKRSGSIIRIPHLKRFKDADDNRHQLKYSIL